jgi:hypothetical protein
MLLFKDFVLGQPLTRWFRQQGMRGLLTDDVEVLIREHETGSGSRPAGD